MGDHIKTQGEKWPPLSEGERPQKKTNPTHTFILDFQPPELGKNFLLLFKSPSLWCFVMAAWANKYSTWSPPPAHLVSRRILALEGHISSSTHTFSNNMNQHQLLKSSKTHDPIKCLWWKCLHWVCSYHCQCPIHAPDTAVCLADLQYCWFSPEAWI